MITCVPGKDLTANQKPIDRAGRCRDQVLALGPDCGDKTTAKSIYFDFAIDPNARCSLLIQTNVGVTLHCRGGIAADPRLTFGSEPGRSVVRESVAGV
jgi:hypothetical protein